MVDGDLDERMLDAEFDAWHVYAFGSPVRRLRVRYDDCGEVPNWQDGPRIRTALRNAKRQGWRVYDREPGVAPGEFVILYLIRRVRRAVGDHHASPFAQPARSRQNPTVTRREVELSRPEDVSTWQFAGARHR